MITCRKTWTDIPFAHRQHGHDGHCAWIHGHNWSITLTFGCHRADENGFVIDFGKLRFIKRWIDRHLDHACVFNADDPLREQIVAACPDAWKIYVVPGCSCEGLARHFYEVLGALVDKETGGRAFLVAVEVAEDSKNIATFTPPRANEE
ncbi:MAG: 6-carboxytetrahydropterin synthase [Opitutaceae bacterium]|jgi:6-pyruvoyltetrahydropterin/6-carboxytetrahydropterin synthase|nr:6-carboxytetrahydropterin synthase [Opitutaceae bacterium]